MPKFVFCTHDEGLAAEAKQDQEMTEEMSGGHPSVYIVETVIHEK